MSQEVLNEDPYLKWGGGWETFFEMVIPIKGDGL
jgi:hypothetical protein